MSISHDDLGAAKCRSSGAGTISHSAQRDNHAALGCSSGVNLPGHAQLLWDERFGAEWPGNPAEY